MTGPAPVTGALRGAGGCRLRTVRWEIDAPRAAVVLVHGFGEHVGRYDHVARFLNERGYAVVGYDQRGHGDSEGRRGVLAAFDLLVEDLHAVRAEAAALGAPGRPFLVGHSMGGLVLARYLQTRGPDTPGAVLSAPWLATAAPVPRWKLAAAAVLRWVAPDLTLRSGIDPEQLTRDPEAQRRYAEDPSVHDRVSSRWFDEIRRAQERTLAGSLPGPALVLVPSADPVADPAVTLAWSRRAGEGDVSTEILEGLRHEPFQEIGRERVMERLAGWIDARAPARRSGGGARPGDARSNPDPRRGYAG